MENLRYKNYDCIDSKTVKESLEKYGVAVIPNVLNEKETEEMENGIWNTLNYITKDFEKPINKNEVDTWNTWYDFLPGHHMLTHGFSIGHHQFVWDVRQNPKVVEVFANLWECKSEELISSFDALSFHIPPEKTNIGWYEGKDWFHIDSPILANSMECVQGLVNAFDVNDSDATLSIIEGSHKYHHDYYNSIISKYPSYIDKNWNSFKKEDLIFFEEKGCERFQVKAKKGSLVLWDSKTIHCGIGPQQNREKENFRLVCYVCMTPRWIVPEKDLERRKFAFENLYMTGHCPYNTVIFRKTVLYPNNPELEPIVPIPKLTNLGMKLAGY